MRYRTPDADEEDDEERGTEERLNSARPRCITPISPVEEMLQQLQLKWGSVVQVGAWGPRHPHGGPHSATCAGLVVAAVPSSTVLPALHAYSSMHLHLTTADLQQKTAERTSKLQAALQAAEQGLAQELAAISSAMKQKEVCACMFSQRCACMRVCVCVCWEGELAAFNGAVK